MTSGHLRAAIYARVSTTGQADNTSLDHQLRVCRARAEAEGWQVVGEYVDVASGAKRDRPQLSELMETARAGNANIVTFSKLDRFGRSLVHTLTLIEELVELGVRVVSVGDAMDSSDRASFDLSLGIMGTIAQHERARIVERMTDGMEARLKDGGFVSSRPPFGYRVAPDPRGRGVILKVDHKQARTIRRIFELAITQRLGVKRTVETLNREGHLTHTGQEWNPARLQAWLRRDGGPRKAAGIWRRGGHEVLFDPILTPEQVAEWEAWLEDTSRHRRVPRRYLLSGLIEGLCGSTFYGRHPRTAKKNQSPIYVCPNRLDRRVGDPLRCDDQNVRMEPLDDAVWAEVKELLSSPESLNTLTRLQSRDRRGRALEELVRRADELQQQVADEYQAALRDGFDAHTARLMVQGRRDELTEARDAVAAAGRRQAAARGAKAHRTSLRGVAKRLDGLTEAEKRQVLEVLGVRVQIVGYEPCSACGGTGFGPGRRENRPYACDECRQMKILPKVELHIMTPHTAAEGAS